MSSVTLTPIPRSSTRGERQPAHKPHFSGRERVTLDNLWPDALPFICLAAMAGIIVYLVSWN